MRTAEPESAGDPTVTDFILPQQGHTQILYYYTQSAYGNVMRALFIELPAFERLRNQYLDDESFRAMQNAMMDDPSAGDVIQGTGVLRKLRWTDKRRGKGKRGGLRVMYFYWVRGLEFWLFTLYDTNELSDLSKKDRATLENLLKIELKMRK
jgi:hypothetical protein